MVHKKVSIDRISKIMEIRNANILPMLLETVRLTLDFVRSLTPSLNDNVNPLNAPESGDDTNPAKFDLTVENFLSILLRSLSTALIILKHKFIPQISVALVQTYCC